MGGEQSRSIKVGRSHVSVRRREEGSSKDRDRDTDRRKEKATATSRSSRKERDETVLSRDMAQNVRKARHDRRSRSPERSRDISPERHSHRRSRSRSCSQSRSHSVHNNAQKEAPSSLLETMQDHPPSKRSMDALPTGPRKASLSRTNTKQTTLYGRLGLPLSASGAGKEGGMSIIGRGGTLGGKKN